MRLRHCFLCSVLLLIGLASPAAAQQEVDASRIYLGLSGATLTFLTGSGSPEGVTTGAVNQQYYDILTGEKYRKASGAGNTGWVKEAGTVTSITVTVPTGLTATGCTITTSGTCAISLTAGYMIPGGGNAGDWLKSNAGSAPSFAAPAALTKVDDTNVTVTLGGAPTTALLNAASLTLGWTGQLSVPRGGTGAATWATNGVIYGQGASAFAVTAQGPANSVLTANAGAPAFSATPTVEDITITDDATVGDTLTLSAASPIGTFNLASFVSKSPQATRYSTSFFIDQDTATVNWLNYDSTGAAYIASVFRGLSFDFMATVSAEDFEVRGDILPETSYVSNLGSAAKKFLTVNAAELLVETLVAQDVMATIGGRVVVAPTTTLTAAVGTGDLSITVKHNNLAAGDILRLEAGGQVEFMSVLASCTGSGPYICTVTRNLDGSGLNSWTEGDAVLNTGTTGDGVIDLFSTSGMLSGTGPTIMGSVRTGTTYSALSPRWVIGELNGLYDYAASTYGFAAGDKDGAWIKVDATNGVRIGYDTTTKIELQPDGDAVFSGQITSTSGAIGGFTLATNTLSAGTDADYVAMSSGGTNAFWAGDSTFDDAEFSVTSAGVVNITDLKIKSGAGGAATTYLWANNGASADDKWRITALQGRLWINGLGTTTEQFQFYSNSGGAPYIYIPDGAFGTTNPGTTILLGYNSSGSDAAAAIGWQAIGGGFRYTWVDNTGVFRIHTAQPAEDGGTTADTAGTVVGSQSSLRATKNIYSEFTDNAGALAAILATPLYDFDYKSGAYNHQRFVGITTDDSPIFGMDLGRSFNPVTAFGFTVGAIKELERRLSLAEAELAKERRK